MEPSTCLNLIVKQQEENSGKYSLINSRAISLGSVILAMLTYFVSLLGQFPAIYIHFSIDNSYSAPCY
jgi:hypothetical protein